MKVDLMENKILYGSYVVLFSIWLAFIIFSNVPHYYAGRLVRLQYSLSSVHEDKIFSLHILNSNVKEWGFQSNAICGRYIVVDEVKNKKSEKSLWINFDQETVTELSNDDIKRCLEFSEKNSAFLYEPVLGILLMNKFIIPRTN
jgi:hypothetical protein